MQTLKDVMSRDVQVIGPNGTIQEAARQMLKGNFGMLPVEDNNRMIGAISDRDIAIRGVAEGKGNDTKVSDVMTEGVICANEDDTLSVAAKLMSEHQIRRLPVVNKEKKLVGIIALGDVAIEADDVDIAGQALSDISETD